MQKIINIAELKTAIRQLESQQANEWLFLKDQLRDTVESLKLINVIKSSLKEGISSPHLITNSIKAAIGITTGLVTKKLLIGKTINPLKKMLGIIIEMVVAKNVVKNAAGIKSIGSLILKKIGNKKVELDNR